MAQTLPISLLELNTFAHALCALLIFCLWLDKPLDIEQPFVIKKERAHDVCALLCYCSEFEPAKDARRVDFPLVDAGSGALSSRINPTHRREKLREWRSEIRETDMDSGRLEFWAHVPGTAPAITGTKKPQNMNDGLSRWFAGIRTFTQRDRNRWNMAYLTSQRCDLEDSNFTMRVPSWINQKDISFDSSTRDRMRNLPVDFPYFEGMELIPDRSKLRDPLGFLSAFAVAGLMYGGLHLLAWDAPFNGRVQELLWKISGIAVISSGLSLFSYIVLWYGVIQLWMRSQGSSSASPIRILSRIVLSVFLVLLLSFLLLYLCARTYLVVECFISFAYLPDEVFQDVEWSGYFPHIQ
jgi:hypothetical protein